MATQTAGELVTYRVDNGIAVLSSTIPAETPILTRDDASA